MSFENALNEINKVYETTKIALEVAVIKIDKMLDKNNLYYVVLKDKNEKLILTDYAHTCEIINLGEDKFKEICKKYGIEFNNWNIEKTFNSIADLETYIACLDEIKNNI